MHSRTVSSYDFINFFSSQPEQPKNKHIHVIGKGSYVG